MKTNLSENRLWTASSATESLGLSLVSAGSRAIAPRSGKSIVDELSAIKEKVVANLEHEFAGTLGAQFLRQAVNEAAALAATTTIPALVLPTLALEKAQLLSAWSDRQAAIRNHPITLAA